MPEVGQHDNLGTSHQNQPFLLKNTIIEPTIASMTAHTKTSGKDPTPGSGASSVGAGAADPASGLPAATTDRQAPGLGRSADGGVAAGGGAAAGHAALSAGGAA